MKLYLVRHGEAESSRKNPCCPLSEEGRREVNSVAAVLARKGVAVDRIECSTKERAMETADILAGALGIADKVVVRDGLKPGDPVQIVLDELRDGNEDRMLVGHMPYMPKMLETLLGSVKEAGKFVFTTATVVCLSGEPGRSWKVEWIESP